MTYINGNTGESIDLDRPVNTCEEHDIKFISNCPACLIKVHMEGGSVEPCKECGVLSWKFDCMGDVWCQEHYYLRTRMRDRVRFCIDCNVRGHEAGTTDCPLES